jgi:hypothetical protein
MEQKMMLNVNGTNLRNIFAEMSADASQMSGTLY